jgi:GNAT superfamily N-acetyltransferase
MDVTMDAVTVVPLRRASTSDTTALVELIHAAYRDPDQPGWTTEAGILGGQRIDADMLADLLADPDTTILVGTDGDAIIACGALRVTPPGLDAHFGLFAVAPSRQAGGVGRKLLQHAEDTAVATGAHRMRLEVISLRSELLAWYDRRGYRPTGERLPFPSDERFGLPQRDDLEFVILERSLRSSDGNTAAEHNSDAKEPDQNPSPT